VNWLFKGVQSYRFSSSGIKESKYRARLAMQGKHTKPNHDEMKEWI